MTIRTMSKIVKRTNDDKDALSRLNKDEVNLVNRMIKNRKTVASLRTIVSYINIVKRIYKIKGLTFSSPLSRKTSIPSTRRSKPPIAVPKITPPLSGSGTISPMPASEKA